MYHKCRSIAIEKQKNNGEFAQVYPETDNISVTLDSAKTTEKNAEKLTEKEDVVEKILPKKGRLKKTFRPRYVKLETDDELIEGATLNITYQIKAINQSEVDYMSENYYKYGIKEGNIATLTPSAVIDYLDKNLGFEDNDNKDESGNSIWQQISKVKLQEFKAQKVNDGGYLDNKKILYT